MFELNKQAEAHLVCATNPVFEEDLGLGVEGAAISQSGQQDVGSPVLVHPVIPVLPTHNIVLQCHSLSAMLVIPSQLC